MSSKGRLRFTPMSSIAGLVLVVKEHLLLYANAILNHRLNAPLPHTGWKVF
jgi:hypothetical protein